MLFISLFVNLYVEFDPGTHKFMHSVLPLKLGVTYLLFINIFCSGASPTVFT
jgi:hypothetical protein